MPFMAYNILGESKHALWPSGPARVWASMRDESVAGGEICEQELHACRWILKQQNYAQWNSAH